MLNRGDSGGQKTILAEFIQVDYFKGLPMGGDEGDNRGQLDSSLLPHQGTKGTGVFRPVPLVPGAGNAAERWAIVVRDEGGHEVPFDVRMRRWLKAGLRGYGVRCVSATDEKQQQPEERKQE